MAKKRQTARPVQATRSSDRQAKKRKLEMEKEAAKKKAALAAARKNHAAAAKAAAAKAAAEAATAAKAAAERDRNKSSKSKQDERKQQATKSINKNDRDAGVDPDDSSEDTRSTIRHDDNSGDDTYDDDDVVDLEEIDFAAPKLVSSPKTDRFASVGGARPKERWRHWLDVDRGHKKGENGDVAKKFTLKDRDECAVQVWKWFTHAARTPSYQTVKTDDGQVLAKQKWSTPDYFFELGASLLIRWRYCFPRINLQMGRKKLGTLDYIMHPTAFQDVEAMIERLEAIEPFLGTSTPADFLDRSCYGTRLYVSSSALFSSNASISYLTHVSFSCHGR